MSIEMILSLSIFIIAYIFIAAEKINKVIVALAGATVFMLCGFVSQPEAFAHHIDWNVIFLLIGMMIMVGVIKNTGIFGYIALFLAKKAKGNPKIILIMLFFFTGLFSAFLDNVTTVVVTVPIAILIAVELGISPIPFVLATAIASNIGGAATLIGDPPNLMIGSAAGLSFMDFIVNQAVIVWINMFVCAAVIYLFFRKQMVVPNERRARIMEFEEKALITDKGLLIYSVIIFVLFIALLTLQEILGLHTTTIALISAVLLLLRARKINIEKFINNEIDWNTILFFLGLFVMVGALEETGVISFFSSRLLSFTMSNLKLAAVSIIWAAGVASAFLDNIPFVAAMIPMLNDVAATIGTEQARPLWWSFALGACLGGNGTLIGATANIIAVGICKKSNYAISFWTFTKYGAVITLISLFLSTIYVLIRYF